MITAALRATTQNADFIVVFGFFKPLNDLWIYILLYFFSPKAEIEGLILPCVVLAIKVNSQQSQRIHPHDLVNLQIHKDDYSL